MALDIVNLRVAGVFVLFLLFFSVFIYRKGEKNSIPCISLCLLKPLKELYSDKIYLLGALCVCVSHAFSHTSE